MARRSDATATHQRLLVVEGHVLGLDILKRAAPVLMHQLGGKCRPDADDLREEGGGRDDRVLLNGHNHTKKLYVKCMAP
jgi:hypothetical protein